MSMPRMHPAAALLDLDGTLLDTEPLHVEAHRRFLDQQGIPVSDAELWGNIGKSDRELYAQLLRRAGLTGDPLAMIESKAELLRDIYGQRAVPWCRGAPELLESCFSSGICTMVVTSSDRRTVAAALRSAGAQSRLPMRVCADDVTRRKPDAQPYLLAATRLQVPPARCIAVEDSVAGVSSAVAAGIGTVIAVPGHIAADALRAAGAQRIAHDLLEVASWLR